MIKFFGVLVISTLFLAGAPTAPASADQLPLNAATASAAAGKDSAQLRAFKKAIRAKYALKEKAFAQHDADTIVTKFYAADVISIGEGEGVRVGREQIRPLYEEVVKDNQVKIESVYSFVNGEAGWDWANFHVRPTDGKTKPFTFAILFLWAKVDGEWMCKGDFFIKGNIQGGAPVSDKTGQK